MDLSVVEVLCWGYQISFSSRPPLSPVLIPFVSYSPFSIKGTSLLGEVHSLIVKGTGSSLPWVLQLPVRCS